MRKTDKFFSFSFFKDTVHKILIPILIALAATVISSGMTAVTYLSFLGETNTRISLSFNEINVFADTFVTAFAPIITIFAFSFLTKRADADFYEALPITRTAILVSGASAIISAGAIILITSTAVPLLLLTPCYGSVVTVSFGRLLLDLLARLLAFILGVAASAVAVSLCGKVTEAGLTAYTILCAPRLLMWLIIASVAALNPTVIYEHIIPLFNNNYNLFSTIMVGSEISPWAYLYTPVLILGYSALALWLFNRRRSERAAHRYENVIAEQAVKITLTTVFIISGVFLLCKDSFMGCFAAFVFILAVVYYTCSSISEARKEKSGRASLIALPILLGVNLIIILTIFITNAIMLSFSPDKDEISSVSLVSTDNYTYIDFSKYVDLRSENVEIADEEVRAVVADALDRGMDYGGLRDYYEISLKIKVGAFYSYRNVILTKEEYNTLNSARAKSDSFSDMWLDIADGAADVSISAHGTTLSGREAEAVLAAMQDEVRSLGFESWYSIYFSGDSLASISYFVYRGGDQYTVSLPLPSSLSATSEIYRTEMTKARKNYLDAMRAELDAASSDKEGVSLSVSFAGKDFYYYVDEDINSDNILSKDLTERLFSIITYDIPEDDENLITIHLYSDGLINTYYAQFALADGVTEQEAINDFFKRYAILE